MPLSEPSGRRGRRNSRMTSFRDLGLSDGIIQTLDDLGYEHTTAIQEPGIAGLLPTEVIALFCGQPVAAKQARLRPESQVVVATVGRTLDLVSRESLGL